MEVMSFFRRSKFVVVWPWRARDVVSSLLAPLQEQMPEVCTFAVPDLPPHAIAVLPAAVLDWPSTWRRQRSRAAFRRYRVAADSRAGTGFDSHVAHRLAVDADIRRGHVKPGELQEEG